MRETGTVKSYNDAKGFGWIAREVGQDVYVHQSDIVAEGVRTLHDGDSVSFEVVKAPKGLMAKNVVRE